jgi:hypothetical protein
MKLMDTQSANPKHWNVKGFGKKPIHIRGYTKESYLKYQNKFPAKTKMLTPFAPTSLKTLCLKTIDWKASENWKYSRG